MTHRTASSLPTPLFPGPQGKKKYPEFFLLMSFTYLGKVEPPKFYFSRVVSFSGPEWALPGAGQRKLPLHQECLAPHPKQSIGFRHQHWFCPKPPGLVCDFRPVTIALFLSLWAPLYFLCERTGYIKSAVLFQKWSGCFCFCFYRLKSIVVLRGGGYVYVSGPRSCSKQVWLLGIFIVTPQPCGNL